MKINQTKPAIGLLGGTFNPIHNGHLRLALEIYERLSLAEVRLIPSAQPPHRAIPSVSSKLRLEMVQAAIAGVNGLIADDRELQRDGPSYMVDTLFSLRAEYPDNPLCLILGSDAFMNLNSWYQSTQIINLAHIIVVRRPNTVLTIQNINQTNQLNQLYTSKAGKIWVEELPDMAISATQIRDLIAAGNNPNYLLPLAVLDIINHNRIYR
ncbi:nicotinate-nucleotide adenylyltransferase [Candidatus Marithrix sp. Canyon 246]|uniref:nicotinate-nucleotide adenylyltransferase n=1 Tax=Candidatus Marithrix sp. Canyon 246 TaxID=1827136 RepID=UPI00084A0AA5|nr:nicotinate-nucleotide adenylyltransferase [Candidatus Marithrix sp. Canyon 246]